MSSWDWLKQMKALYSETHFHTEASYSTSCGHLITYGDMVQHGGYLKTTDKREDVDCRKCLYALHEITFKEV